MRHEDRVLRMCDTYDSRGRLPLFEVISKRSKLLHLPSIYLISFRSRRQAVIVWKSEDGENWAFQVSVTMLAVKSSLLDLPFGSLSLFELLVMFCARDFRYRFPNFFLRHDIRGVLGQKFLDPVKRFQRFIFRDCIKCGVDGAT